VNDLKKVVAVRMKAKIQQRLVAKARNRLVLIIKSFWGESKTTSGKSDLPSSEFSITRDDMRASRARFDDQAQSSRSITVLVPARYNV
jgi:hypothetical protein